MGSTLLYNVGQGNPLDHFGLLGSTSNTHLGLFLKVHLKKNSKAVDIHLWGVVLREPSLRSCVDWIVEENTVNADLFNGVSWAIV